jgi:NAD(P)-dependent dehydrogenase (short-subunit alcohol dehydrogenase family)
MNSVDIPVTLHGRVALVTGSGRGIGRKIGIQLARAGAQVIISARTSGQIEAVAEEISRKGGRGVALRLDVADEENVVSVFREIADRFGRLDILVNNAGVGEFGPISRFPADLFDEILAVNLRGTFLCCRQALALMMPRKSGYIINISSVVGFKGYAGQGAYAASKHGIMGLTKTLAIEAQAHGIRVSAILPGGVDTTLICKARPDIDRATLIRPEDVARTVLFLLSLSDRAAIDEIYIRREISKPF